MKNGLIGVHIATNTPVEIPLSDSEMQLFHAGKTKYPDGDNWVVTRVLEEIVGAELHR